MDEVVLVDTGSTDDTVAIAERFGCRVFFHPWTGNFAEARNTGLDSATGEWILYIDADECLSCPAGATLSDMISAAPPAAGYLVKFYPGVATTAYEEYRVFRNDPRIRFVGAMHESIVPGLRRVCAEDDLPMLPLHDAVIRHFGYEGDLTAKHARNLPLLEQAISTYPRRVYLRYHLGQTLRSVGRAAEAVEHLERGIELGRSGTLKQDRVEGSMCAAELAGIHADEGDLAGALAIVESGLPLYPRNMALHWAKARSFTGIGREEEAVAILTGILDQDPDVFFDPAIGYRKSIFTTERHSLLGSALFRLGRYAEAAVNFEAAALTADDPTEFRAKAALARARAARSNVA